MKYFIFVNKYYTKCYNDLGEKVLFNYNEKKYEFINNTGYLDIEKEIFVLQPDVSPFTVGYNHYFSVDNIFGEIVNKLYFIAEFLNQVFEMLDDANDVVVIFSSGAIGNVDMQPFNSIIRELFENMKISCLNKDLLFVGAITFLSLIRKKSIALVSGFNVISSKVFKNDLYRDVKTIWEDKNETLENIKYYQGKTDFKDDNEYQRAFDLALDSRLNYGSYDIHYETRDHDYIIDAHILDDYINKIKENIKSVIDNEMFYLFDINFPLIYDEFLKGLNIDVEKNSEMDEFYKYIIEFTMIILEYNTDYSRIIRNKKKNHSLFDGFTEYEIEFVTNKKRNDLKKLFKTKYIKD